MGKSWGFGKTILFGEHFVVYGLPAIASALGSYTTANAEEGEPASGLTLIDERPVTPGYKERKKPEQDDSMNNILAAMDINVDKNPVKITLGGNLVAASGVGASAASCAAIARALSAHLGLNLSDEEINKIAYEGEKGYHGTPSGIDNTAATYGGLIWFRKNLKGGPNTMERIKLKEPVELVIGNSGLTSNTKEVVGDVRAKKEAQPEKYAAIFAQYEKLVNDARCALDEFDVKRIGELMNDNHGLLQQITVSCAELDDMVDTAKDAGAYGAKLTGTGRGGLMIALTPGEELQEKVASAIEGKGVSVIRTKIGI